MAQSRMGEPVHARYLLGVESDFFVQSAAETMKRPAFHRVPQSFGIDDQSAVVSTDKTLYPDMASLTIHFYLRDLGNNGLTPE